MPLTKSSSPEAFKSNLKAEMNAGKPQKQALAIAYSVKRRAKKSGGQAMADGGVPWFARQEARSMMHTGPIGGFGLGRKDIHNMSVPAGSHILPSDVVSHLGQNNTAAGMTVAHQMFGGSGPYGSGSSGPYGVKIPGGRAGGTGAPKPPKLGKMAKGGSAEDKTGQPVPIVTASGEYSIEPDVVKNIGGGDLEKGHKIIDRWILQTRKRHIKTLRKLPPPAKD